jgi:DNA-binding NtrC family response regulator
MVKVMSTEQARILVVDDDEQQRELLSVLLKRHGYSVESASDGHIAWSLLNTESGYELVITDLNMPVMDGLILLQKIRERHLSVEVILVTGFLSYGVAMKARDLGAFAVITKPFNLEQLLQTVGAAITRRAVA